MLTLLTASLTLALGLLFNPSLGFTAVVRTNPSDSDITTWIHYALTHDPRTVGWDISVETRGGIVTLMGQVDNLAAKNFAGAEAKKIRGVRGIINEVNVVPVYRAEADIAHDVRRRLENSTAVDAGNLVVVAHEGVVTLSGEVADWNQKEEARLLAEAVRGVKDVVDEVELRNGEPIGDERLAAESRARLARDVFLTDLPITVEVKNSEITLTGAVGNLYEKERAGRSLRWQNGVRTVHNKLKVEPWESYGARDKVAFPSDDELKRNVRTELMTDLRLTPEGISIEAVAGHVMLFGAVPSLRQKRIAEQDARDVVGTAWITNDLIVHTTARDDSAIQDQIVFNIGTDPYLRKAALNVSVDGGVATLAGDVPSLFEMQRATDLAADVIGVVRVVNNLTVRRMPDLTDDVLKDQVIQRLKDDWRIASVYQDIRVDVSDGVARLTGDVNAWSERREAGQAALRTRGVLAVDNRLTVRGVPYPWDEWRSKMLGCSGLYDPYEIDYPYDRDGS